MTTSRLTPAERHAVEAILDRPYADPDDDAAIAARAARRLALPEPDKLLLAQRNDLYWYALMLRQGGPDGSELDQAVTEDGDAVIAAVGVEMDAWDEAAPTASPKGMHPATEPGKPPVHDDTWS